MAKSFLTDINLNRNVLLNAKIQAWGSAPTGTGSPDASGNAVAGQISSYLGDLYIFTGASGTPANTWSRVGNTLSDNTNTTSSTTGASSTAVKAAYDLAAAALPKSGGTMTGAIAMGSNNITGTGSISATTFTGALTGSVTGNVSGSAGTVTGLSVASTKTLTVSNTLTLAASNDTSTLNIGTGGTLASGAFANIGLYATLASPTFTGTVSGITKSMVGLGSVDNTADSAKPVSTAQQTALDLKANLASPTFTGTVTTAGIAMGNNKITGLGNPTANQEAATKYYVDNSIANSQAGFNVHTAVRVATTANLTGTYTAGTSDNSQGTGIGATFVGTAVNIGTIDAVLLVQNDRVLLKNQTTATQNGIYTVTTVSTNITLTRAADFDNSVAGEVFPGDLVYVTAGTANGGSTWAQTTVGTSTSPANAVKIGTDSIVWAQFAGTTGGVLPGSQGGTGVANTDKTITLGGNLVTSGSSALTLTTTGTTNATVPAGTVTLVDLASSQALTTKTYNGLTVTANGTNTLNIAAGKSLIVSETMTLTAGAASQTFTFPSTSATIARTDAGQIFTGTQTFTTIEGPSTLTIQTPLSTTNVQNNINITGGNNSRTGGSTAGSNIILTGGNLTGASTSASTAGEIYLLGGTATNGKGGGLHVETRPGSDGQGTVRINASGGSLTYPAAGGIAILATTTTITGGVALPTVGTSGFVKLGASGALSSATIAYTDLPTASLTGVTTDGIARKKTGLLTANSSTTAFAIAHGFGQWVTAQLFDTSGNLVEVDVLNAATGTPAGTTTFTFATAPTTGTNYQYVIVG